jgi:hypothetical protein
MAAAPFQAAALRRIATATIFDTGAATVGRRALGPHAQPAAPPLHREDGQRREAQAMDSNEAAGRQGSPAAGARGTPFRRHARPPEGWASVLAKRPAFSLFDAQDLTQWRAAQFPDAPMPLRDPQAVAETLSESCFRWLDEHQRHRTESQADSAEGTRTRRRLSTQRRLRLVAERRKLQALVDLVEQLSAALDGDLHDIFPPDIGHADEVQRALGEPGDTRWPDGLAAAHAAMRRDSQRIEKWVAARAANLGKDRARHWSPTDPGSPPPTSEAWRVIDDAAREATHLLYADPTPRRFLRVLAAAARHQIETAHGPMKSGPPSDWPRHWFVFSVGWIYEELSGSKLRNPTVASPTDARVKSGKVRDSARIGKAAAFLAQVLSTMAERLLPEEQDDDISQILSAGSRETAAGQWIETAFTWAAQFSPGTIDRFTPSWLRELRKARRSDGAPAVADERG